VIGANRNLQQITPIFSNSGILELYSVGIDSPSRSNHAELNRGGKGAEWESANKDKPSYLGGDVLMAKLANSSRSLTGVLLIR
jgi:hypothetical protein